MQFRFILIQSLLIVFPVGLLSFSNVIWSSKNSTIVHLETGLLLDYVGLYRPSDTIIHNSVIFPMATETCYFLPLEATVKIPSCNVTQRINKRALLGVIALGVGIINLGINTMNSIQIDNLHKQVDIIEKALSKFNKAIDIHEAKLVNIHMNQIKFVEQLQVTQQAINSLLPILDSHAKLLNKLKTDIVQLHNHFQRSFLALSINQIFHNQFNLNFLLPDDLHRVVYNIIEQGNLTFSNQYASIPLVEIITKLLVHQQVNFIPNSQKNNMNFKEIGHLVITNYFAVPQQQPTSFNVYKLLTVPFFHHNQSLQLSDMPQYWAINPVYDTTLEWYQPEEYGCNLQLMTTCRDTPPLRTITQDTCLGQILNQLPLTNCHMKSTSPMPFFLQQLTQNVWIVSAPRPIHCVKIPKTEYHPTHMQHIWTNNEPIIIPPVALVNVTPGYTIVCPRFTLVGRPNTTKNSSSLTILSNHKLVSSSTTVVDIYQHLTENTTWFKTNWSETSIETLLNHTHQPIAMPTLETYAPIHNWSSIRIVLIGLITTLFIIILNNYFFKQRYQRNK
ncbi:unnamed protein product [Rotaria magnacalcarata]|uniref:Uncharacterized protein n=1 Tax=Rotaria magnacalcarata TaxID=392030 RepID=A0A816DCC0_9BILA|nr:unnamed protein product [Rotaria magnacalcarata]CAF1632859.1 unnamed protein product [Rotaria magnacalcarata]CAF3774939.1 unnamed protein product [Rotaria magnacalcarata]CAF3799956.1 unnamed protein product [Rotaria magnacalcarata]